jgi:hypothetical protein
MAVLGIAVLAGLGWAWLSRSAPQPVAQTPAKLTSERFYRATGQVTGLKALGAKGCEVTVKMHQWASLSPGFGLAEVPRKGQIYRIGTNPEQCLAVEVALASQGDPNDLKSPRHIFYTAAQNPQGRWNMRGSPQAPQGCGGL